METRALTNRHFSARSHTHTYRKLQIHKVNLCIAFFFQPTTPNYYNTKLYQYFN